MDLKFFDSHCHPYTSQFDADREEVLLRMVSRGVGGIVVGTDLAESKEAVELASEHDFLWASVGLHPTDNTEEEFDAAAYRKLAQNPKVVAIGECGLDYYRGETPEFKKQFQKDRFQKQLELSIELKKPLIIHCRPSPNTQDAHEDMLEILFAYSHEWANRPPVIHFFTSTREIAEKYLALGCYISFPGVITFANLDDVVRAVPIDRILSETDSPYAAPIPYRGKRNEPAYVEEIVKKIAEIKNLSIEKTASQILLNSELVFGIAR
jgi:TatD DNase family protein